MQINKSVKCLLKFNQKLMMQDEILIKFKKKIGTSLTFSALI